MGIMQSFDTSLTLLAPSLVCSAPARKRLKINMFKIPDWNYNEFTGCKEIV